ncbi:MAG: DUF1636 family protein [Marinibacterium sp.]
MTHAESAILRVCTGCAEGSVDLCARLIADARLDRRVAVRGQDCLNCCARPVALALQGEGRITYVFDGLDLGTDGDDVVATLRAYLERSDGAIVDARACGRLRHCLRARILPPRATGPAAP